MVLLRTTRCQKSNLWQIFGQNSREAATVAASYIQPSSQLCAPLHIYSNLLRFVGVANVPSFASWQYDTMYSCVLLEKIRPHSIDKTPVSKHSFARVWKSSFVFTFLPHHCLFYLSVYRHESFVINISSFPQDLKQPFGFSIPALSLHIWYLLLCWYWRTMGFASLEKDGVNASRIDTMLFQGLAKVSYQQLSSCYPILTSS